MTDPAKFTRAPQPYSDALPRRDGEGTNATLRPALFPFSGSDHALHLQEQNKNQLCMRGAV